MFYPISIRAIIPPLYEGRCQMCMRDATVTVRRRGERLTTNPGYVCQRHIVRAVAEYERTMNSDDHAHFVMGRNRRRNGR